MKTIKEKFKLNEIQFVTTRVATPLEITHSIGSSLYNQSELKMVVNKYAGVCCAPKNSLTTIRN